MRSRIAVLFIPFVLLAATVAAAQTQGAGPGGGGGFGQRRTQRLFQGITLTAEQQAKVDSITAKYRAQMPAFTPGTPPTPPRARKCACCTATRTRRFAPCSPPISRRSGIRT